MERPPGCLVVWMTVSGGQLGALLLILGAAIVSRSMDPPWIRALPVAVAAAAAWTVFSQWLQPRMDQWSSDFPSTSAGLLARLQGRPWMWKLSVVAWSLLAGLGAILAR